MTYARTTGFIDEDGGMELQETVRLRDRGSKKNRDRERSGRSKRRKGDRILHGTNKDEGEESSEESIDEDEEDDDDDASGTVRPPPPPHQPSPPPSSSLSNHNHRKAYPTKVIRGPVVWKVADEMIGVSIPRKARSAYAKRSPECWVSGSGCAGGSGEPIHRQASASPPRLGGGASAPVPTSPSSSNASVRKKMKQISGTKHRPPKILKSPSSIQEIEIEVAEVLYGLTRQFQVPLKQEFNKPHSKDANESSYDTKSRVSSPSSISPPPAVSQGLLQHSYSTAMAPLPAVAPKRKRPRLVKVDDKTPADATVQAVHPSSSISSTCKTIDGDETRVQVQSPRLPTNAEPMQSENGTPSLVQVEDKPASIQDESMKPESSSASDVKPPVTDLDRQNKVEKKDEIKLLAKEPVSDELITNCTESDVKLASAADSPKEKFKIDLMAPPGKSSQERELDFLTEHKFASPDIETGRKHDSVKNRVEKSERSPTTGDAGFELKETKNLVEEYDSRSPVNKKSLDVKLEPAKSDKEEIICGKLPGPRQPGNIPKAEPTSEKTGTIFESLISIPYKLLYLDVFSATQAGSLPLPMAAAGWPGGLPFGYMGLQPAVPIDGTAAPTMPMRQLRPKRCAIHCYIAHNICFHQQIAQMNPFWPVAAGSTPMFGTKPYNLNLMPSSASAILSNPLQGGFPGGCLGSLQDKAVPVFGQLPGQSPKEKGSAEAACSSAAPASRIYEQYAGMDYFINVLLFGCKVGNTDVEISTVVFCSLFFSAHSGFHFPSQSTPGAYLSSGCGKVLCCECGSSSVSSSAAASSSGSGLPHWHNCLELLYFAPGGSPVHSTSEQWLSFSHSGPCWAPPFRVGNHPQPMAFLNASFYASQMLHHPQLQQLPPPPPPLPQQQHYPNPQDQSKASPSSSQKYPQPPQKAPDGSASVGAGSAQGFSNPKRQHIPLHQPRQTETETGGEDSPPADHRLPQAQRGIFCHSFSVPAHHQNLAFMPAGFTTIGGANHSEKQPLLLPQQHQHHQNLHLQNMKPEAIPQTLAMPYAAFNGIHGFDLSSPPRSGQEWIPVLCTAAATASPQGSAQNKKVQQQLAEDGKQRGKPINVGPADEEHLKTASPGKASSGVSQCSLSPSVSKVDGSSQPLNLVPCGDKTPVLGGSSSTQHQLQQGMLHLPKQHQKLQSQKQQPQQQLQKQQPVSSGTTVNKFPNALAGFPQGMIQGGSPTQSPQWKNSARAAAAAPPSSPVKSNPSQPPIGIPQQNHLSTAGHHAHISFEVGGALRVAPPQLPLVGVGSLSSSSSSAIGPPAGSASRGGGGGSPRIPTGSKGGPTSSSSSRQQLPPTKNSPASSISKSSAVGTRNGPSILGQPQITPPSSAMKSQQQQQASQHPNQLQKNQQYPPSQLFFSPQSNAAATATAYYPRRPSEQHNQPVSSGMLSLCPSALSGSSAASSTDASKSAASAAATANRVKAVAQFSVAPHSAGATFPYLGMSGAPVRPTEQKPTAGTPPLQQHSSRRSDFIYIQSWIG
ncbi:unnamed protein product [Spirodela intermedia]|uniref:Uncharacterized protein n=1 Tax=Spirodela intermedia TaxID=51605 RepID=A0A7I8JB53_SPIIN|nr:unnamed protein product [Spirodela intermedia]CAA6667314.1 unnamed protein product [Spirodela intermedia]